EDGIVVPVVIEIGIGKFVEVLPRRFQVNHHQTAGIFPRRSRKQRSIRNPEAHHAQRHRNRKRKNSNRCQLPVLPQNSKRAPHGPHGRHSATFTAYVTPVLAILPSPVTLLLGWLWN